jgi:hypothetical protein
VSHTDLQATITLTVALSASDYRTEHGGELSADEITDRVKRDAADALSSYLKDIGVCHTVTPTDTVGP